MWSSVEAQDFARTLLESNEARWLHVQGVARRTVQLAPDRDDLIASAWLHDIGYAPSVGDTGMHAIDGAEILRHHGAPPLIVSLVAWHTGAEFEADERALVDRLIAFDRPPQADLDLLTFADLSTGPRGEPVSVAQRFAEIFTRYEHQHPVHRAISRSREYLEVA